MHKYKAAFLILLGVSIGLGISYLPKSFLIEEAKANDSCIHEGASEGRYASDAASRFVARGYRIVGFSHTKNPLSYSILACK